MLTYFSDDQNQALKIVRLIWEEVVKLNDSDIWNIIDGPPTIIKQKNIEDPEAGYIDTFAGYNSNILFVAAKLGNTRFILELLRLYPELVWKLDQENRTIFHIAVLYRQESVYNLLFQIGSTMHQIISLKDMNNNNIVHLAAMKPEQNRLLANTGAGLQMQSEVQWFKVHFSQNILKFQCKYTNLYYIRLLLNSLGTRFLLYLIFTIF